MDQTLRKLVLFVLVLGFAAACGKVGKVAMAAPGDKYCPPLCTLPPDPAPPMPPIPIVDPPINPVAPSNPNSGKSTTKTATAAPAAAAPASVTIVGKKQEGGECKSGNASGTLVLDSGKYSCNFTPSTLKVGAACHANNTIGKVEVVAGDKNRYCQIAP